MKFTNRQAIRPNRFRLTYDDGTESIVELTRVAPENGESLGTPVTAEVLNSAFDEKQNTLSAYDDTVNLTEGDSGTIISALFNEPEFFETDYSYIAQNAISTDFEIDKKAWSATLAEFSYGQDYTINIDTLPYESAYTEFTLRELNYGDPSVFASEPEKTPSFAICFNAENPDNSVLCRFFVTENKIRLIKSNGTIIDETNFSGTLNGRIGVQRCTNLSGGYKYKIYIEGKEAGILTGETDATAKGNVSLIFRNCKACVAYWKTKGKN